MCARQIDPFNVLIADDNPKSAQVLRKAFLEIPGVNVLGKVMSVEMLMAKIKYHESDLLVIDPAGEFGQADMIEQIHSLDPGLPVIVTFLPRLTAPEILVSALEQGCHDCIEKPQSSQARQYKEFRIRMKTVIGLLESRKRKKLLSMPPYKSRFFMPQAMQSDEAWHRLISSVKLDVVVMASSTGGPEILSRMFKLVPRDIRLPILVVQHFPSQISQSFARSLNDASEADIRLANDGEIISGGRVYIAPGGRHMAVTGTDSKNNRYIRLSDAPPVNSVRPSADFLFESVAQSYGRHALAVVLTGMGQDGFEGTRALKKMGCVCLTQSRESCVVYGMPRAVDDAGLSDASLDPVDLTQAVILATT